MRLTDAQHRKYAQDPEMWSELYDLNIDFVLQICIQSEACAISKETVYPEAPPREQPVVERTPEVTPTVPAAVTEQGEREETQLGADDAVVLSQLN